MYYTLTHIYIYIYIYMCVLKSLYIYLLGQSIIFMQYIYMYFLGRVDVYVVLYSSQNSRNN